MKKKLVSAAVSAAMFGSLGAVQTASADSVFGPLFNTTDGVFTFASIITKDGSRVSSGANVPTHWIYLYKDLTNLTATCTHSDGDGRQTINDLGTFFLGNNLAPGGTVFADVDDTSTGFFIAPGFSGMFTVSNRNNNLASESSIAGEVLIADINTGNVLSYRMINDPSTREEAEFDNIAYGSFESRVVYEQPGALGDIPGAPVALWHRQRALQANWFVMAPEDGMANPSVPDLSLTITLAGKRDTATQGSTNLFTAGHNLGFFWDRNENLRSTSRRVTFQCIARLSLADFIDPGNLPSAENTGGWAHVEIVTKHPALPANQRPPIFDANGNLTPMGQNIGLLVYKLEASGAQSVFTSENRIDF